MLVFWLLSKRTSIKVAYRYWRIWNKKSKIHDNKTNTCPIQQYHQILWPMDVRRGAGKSLDRTGRKQATAIKLGIYSTQSPRSSIHFLARCSNFCKPIKKNSGRCPSNQVSAGMTSASDVKCRPCNCFFQSREKVVVRRGQIRKIGWVIKKLEAQVG